MSGLRCLRCGSEGDVRSVLVDLEAEARLDGERIQEVEVVQEIRHRHVTERRLHRVPERYAFEPRCRDKVACQKRVTGQDVEP
jgi:hypothetical protein